MYFFSYLFLTLYFTDVIKFDDIFAKEMYTLFVAQQEDKCLNMIQLRMLRQSFQIIT
jgi:hypothetical protein